MPLAQVNIITGQARFQAGCSVWCLNFDVDDRQPRFSLLAVRHGHRFQNPKPSHKIRHETNPIRRRGQEFLIEPIDFPEIKATGPSAKKQAHEVRKKFADQNLEALVMILPNKAVLFCHKAPSSWQLDQFASAPRNNPFPLGGRKVFGDTFHGTVSKEDIHSRLTSLPQLGKR